MLSWQSGRVDFDDSGGKKDSNVVVVVVGVAVVGVFDEREAAAMQSQMAQQHDALRHHTALKHSTTAGLHIRNDKQPNNRSTNDQRKMNDLEQESLEG